MEVKEIHMERRYEGSNILFLEPTIHTMSLQIWISFFAIVDLTFGKILLIREESQ